MKQVQSLKPNDERVWLDLDCLSSQARWISPADRNRRESQYVIVSISGDLN